jgi:hypothetical protein
MSYIDQLETLGIRQLVISSPTFTQYGKRHALLEHLRAYARRSDARVSTIIGSVRADELSARYLDAVAELGDFGHLFTELRLQNTGAVIAIAPEFASPDLVRLYNKTMTPKRRLSVSGRPLVFSGRTTRYVMSCCTSSSEHPGRRKPIASRSPIMRPGFSMS